MCKSACVCTYTSSAQPTSELCVAPCRRASCMPVVPSVSSRGGGRGGQIPFSNPTFHSFTRKDLRASTALARTQRVPAVWKSSEQPYLLLPTNRVRFPGHRQWSLAPGEGIEARRTAGRTHTCVLYPLTASHKHIIWYIRYVCF